MLFSYMYPSMVYVCREYCFWSCDGILTAFEFLPSEYYAENSGSQK